MRDDFVGSDGQLLENRSGWTLDTDGRLDLKILSNQLEAVDSGSGSRGFYKATPAGADGYVETQITQLTGNGCWLACRFVGVANFVAVRITGSGSTGIKLIKVISGTETELITTQPNVNDVIRIEYEGTTYRLYVNGSQVGSDQTIADGDIATSTDAQGFVVDSASTTNGAMYEYFENSAFDLIKILNETLNIGENSPSVESFLVRILSEVIKNEENRQFTVIFEKIINETINSSETAEEILFIFKMIDEAINNNEGSINVIELARVISETLNTVEASSHFIITHVIAPLWRSIDMEAENRSDEMGEG